MNGKEVLRINLKKNLRGYEAFMVLIAILEGLMMIYGILRFDFRDLKRKIYFSAYVFLFCCTIISMILNRVFSKNDKYEKYMLGNAYIYNTVLIFWAAMISALDIMGGGFAVTYMTILAGVGSMIALPPVFYAFLTILSTAGMVLVAGCIGNVGLRIPFYLNHTIFLLVVVAVEIRNFCSLREQYILDRRLEELASMDGLTKVANRRSLDNYMKELMQEGKIFSFVLLDVDDFKSINDSYGHREGDLSLIRIANMLTSLFGGLVFRYGGDEFAVISFEEAECVAGKMDLVNRHLMEMDTEYVLQICSGVYRNRKEDDERRIFELADRALYEAKQKGKARSVVYRAAELYEEKSTQ